MCCLPRQSRQAASFCGWPTKPFGSTEEFTRSRIRVGHQPITDRRGLRIARFQVKQLEVMGSRPGRIAELFRAEITEDQMRPRFIRMGGEDFLEFIRGINRIVRRLERKGKVVTRVI